MIKAYIVNLKGKLFEIRVRTCVHITVLALFVKIICKYTVIAYTMVAYAI